MMPGGGVFFACPFPDTLVPVTFLMTVLAAVAWSIAFVSLRLDRSIHLPVLVVSISVSLSVVLATAIAAQASRARRERQIAQTTNDGLRAELVARYPDYRASLRDCVAVGGERTAILVLIHVPLIVRMRRLRARS